jgi:hypothetical protein
LIALSLRLVDVVVGFFITIASREKYGETIASAEAFI